VTPDGGKGKISLLARDRSGNPLAASSIEVRVSDPEGNSQKATLNQEAPGVFSGNFDASNVGSYIVSVVEPTATGEARVAANGFSIPYPPEYRSSRPNLPLLEGLASVSGGEKLTDGRSAMRPIANTGDSITDLWRLFLWIALGLLPLDVLMRRVVVPLPKFGRREVEEEDVVAKVADRAVPGEKRPKVKRAKRKKVVSEEPISTAGSLLAAKKKRKDSDSSEND
jgi:Ca-activated chloride channel homolog